MAEEIISRADAQARGLKRYFTGKPCKHGHIALRRTVNGLCCGCSAVIEARWRDKNRDTFRAKVRRQAARHREENPDRIKRNSKRYDDANRPKISARIKRWKLANPELDREYGRRWREANPDKIAKKNRNYKTAHAERLKPINVARVKKWAKDNPDAVRKNVHARRARKKNAQGSHTTEQIKELLRKQNFKCITCPADLRVKRHLDHIHPLSKGGSNDITNLQWLCPSCNCSKHDKDPIEWALSNGRLI